MKAALYRRVSTQEQADSRLGLESQLTLAVAALRREDARISSELFTDAGVSGSVPLSSRKDGRRLSEAIEAGEITLVVALTQDRLFRSLLDALATLQRWDELGVRVLLVDGGMLDMDDDDKWLSTAMRALFAEKERRDARRRTKRALGAARDRGTKLGGVPFGFRTAARIVDGKKLDAGVHVAVPSEQTVIAHVRSLRLGADGKRRPLRAIAAELNAEGIQSPQGGEWHGESVRRVLRRIE